MNVHYLNALTSKELQDLERAFRSDMRDRQWTTEKLANKTGLPLDQAQEVLKSLKQGKIPAHLVCFDMMYDSLNSEKPDLNGAAINAVQNTQDKLRPDIVRLLESQDQSSISKSSFKGSKEQQTAHQIYQNECIQQNRKLVQYQSTTIRLLRAILRDWGCTYEQLCELCPEVPTSVFHTLLHEDGTSRQLYVTKDINKIIAAIPKITGDTRNLEERLSDYDIISYAVMRQIAQILPLLCQRHGTDLDTLKKNTGAGATIDHIMEMDNIEVYQNTQFYLSKEDIASITKELFGFEDKNCTMSTLVQRVNEIINDSISLNHTSADRAARAIKQAMIAKRLGPDELASKAGLNREQLDEVINPPLGVKRRAVKISRAYAEAVLKTLEFNITLAALAEKADTSQAVNGILQADRATEARSRFTSRLRPKERIDFASFGRDLYDYASEHEMHRNHGAANQLASQIAIPDVSVTEIAAHIEAILNCNMTQPEQNNAVAQTVLFALSELTNIPVNTCAMHAENQRQKRASKTRF